MSVTNLASRLRRVEARYSGGEERPLGSYSALMGLYVTGVAAMTAFARSRRAHVPERLPAADLALMTVGVFRASRLITKDSITAVVRSPFTRFEGQAGPDEVNEEVVGRGAPHAVGELLSCPFCISMWLSTTAGFGMVVYPRQTRLVCSVLAAVAGADCLQFGHAALEKLE